MSLLDPMTSLSLSPSICVISLTPVSTLATPQSRAPDPLLMKHTSPFSAPPTPRFSSILIPNTSLVHSGLSLY